MASKTILLLNASPRTGGNTSRLLAAADEALAGIPSIERVMGSVSEDNLSEIAELWLQADGIILGAPVYTYGPPAPLYRFFEELKSLQAERLGGFQHPKPIGLISQGGAAYSGAEQNSSTLQALALSVGCTPVSADMPGFSQAVIGQVPDGSAVDQALLQGAANLGSHVADLIDILEAGKDGKPGSVRLLVVRAGKGCPEELLESIHAGAKQGSPDDLDWDMFDFSGMEIAPCLACTQYCSGDFECIFDDGMQEFREKWLPADGVIWLVGADECGIDAGLVSAIDRMNQIRFETHFGSGQSGMPRYLKAAGVMAVGSEPLQIGESVRFLRQVGVLFQNVVVPQNLKGGPGLVWDDSAGVSPDAQLRAENLGLEVAKLAGCLKSGLDVLSESLPAVFFPSKSKYGLLEKRP